MMLPKDWCQAISKRRSRRQFSDKPIDASRLSIMNQLCSSFQPYEGIRAVLVEKSPEKVFKGVIGSYGKVKGSTAYVAFIADTRIDNFEAKVGYLGEAVILQATSIGLDTCWVGGFHPEAVKEQIPTESDEKVFAVTPLGFANNNWTFEEKLMSGFAVEHKRKKLSEIITQDFNNWPAWGLEAVKAARLAPSAVNRQPWRFRLQGENVIVSCDSLKDTYKISKRLDCGIAMLHFELGANFVGIQGKWEFLKGIDVACFIKGGN